jgi:hypothetical protein
MTKGSFDEVRTLMLAPDEGAMLGKKSYLTMSNMEISTGLACNDKFQLRRRNTETAVLLSAVVALVGCYSTSMITSLI